VLRATSAGENIKYASTMKTKVIALLLLLLPFIAPAQSGSLTIDELEWADANVAQPGSFAPRPDTYTPHYRFGVLTACPLGWRLPTADELTKLNAAGSSNAAAGARGNQVKGRFYGPAHATASLPNNMSGAIFLPVSGLLSADNELINQHSAGYYWSSDALGRNGYALVFHNSYKTWSAVQHVFRHSVGMSLRCVRPEGATGCITLVGDVSGSGGWAHESLPPTGCVTAIGTESGTGGWGYEAVPLLTACVTAVGNLSGTSGWSYEAVPMLTACVSAVGNLSGSGGWQHESLPPTGCVTAIGTVSGSGGWSYEAVPLLTACVTAVGNLSGSGDWQHESLPPVGCVTAIGSISGTGGWSYEAIPTGCVTAIGNLSGSGGWNYEAVPLLTACVTAVGNLSGSSWAHESLPPVGCVSAVGTLSGSSWAFQSLPPMGCVTVVGTLSGANGWAYEAVPAP
jgi:uncharacterized protein (TIGR02145 family)